jgi:CMP/dCMP kinase
MKQILLIDRECGAGGSTIGERLAERLGWRLFDDILTRNIAQLAGIPVDVCRRREERVDPLLHRFINTICRGTFDRNLPSPGLAILDTERLVSLVRQAVEEAAESSPCVIVGRGAPYFLRERSNEILSVYLYAPREFRFRRVLDRVQDDPQRAIDLVDKTDEDRRKFVRRHFGHEWPNRGFFHVMLDTSVGDSVVIESILDLVRALNRRALGGGAAR